MTNKSMPKLRLTPSLVEKLARIQGMQPKHMSFQKLVEQLADQALKQALEQTNLNHSEALPSSNATSTVGK